MSPRFEERLAELRARAGALVVIDDLESDIRTAQLLASHEIEPERDAPRRNSGHHCSLSFSRPEHPLLRDYVNACERARPFPAILAMMHQLDAWQRDLIEYAWSLSMADGNPCLQECAAGRLDTAWEKILALLDHVERESAPPPPAIGWLRLVRQQDRCAPNAEKKPKDLPQKETVQELAEDWLPGLDATDRPKALSLLTSLVEEWALEAEEWPDIESRNKIQRKLLEQARRGKRGRELLGVVRQQLEPYVRWGKSADEIKSRYNMLRLQAMARIKAEAERQGESLKNGEYAWKHFEDLKTLNDAEDAERAAVSRAYAAAESRSPERKIEDVFEQVAAGWLNRLPDEERHEAETCLRALLKNWMHQHEPFRNWPLTAESHTGIHPAEIFRTEVLDQVVTADDWPQSVLESLRRATRSFAAKVAQEVTWRWFTTLSDAQRIEVGTLARAMFMIWIRGGCEGNLAGRFEREIVETVTSGPTDAQTLLAVLRAKGTESLILETYNEALSPIYARHRKLQRERRKTTGSASLTPEPAAKSLEQVDEWKVFDESCKLENALRAEVVAAAKAVAADLGKEPFDLARLETMCDTSSASDNLDPDVDRRSANFEQQYYVYHQTCMTLAAFAEKVEEYRKWPR